MTQVALYARVSSEKQAQENTVDSQISAIELRIKSDCVIRSKPTAHFG